MANHQGRVRRLPLDSSEQGPLCAAATRRNCSFKISSISPVQEAVTLHNHLALDATKVSIFLRSLPPPRCSRGSRVVSIQREGVGIDALRSADR